MLEATVSSVLVCLNLFTRLHVNLIPQVANRVVEVFVEQVDFKDCMNSKLGTL